MTGSPFQRAAMSQQPLQRAEWTIGATTHTGYLVAVASPGTEKALAHLAEPGTPFLYTLPFSEVKLQPAPTPPAIRISERAAILEALRLEVLAWQAQTFPNRTIRSITAHLAKEGRELLGNPTDCLEYADVQMLSWAADHELATMLKANDVDVIDCVRQKLAINRQRTWGAPGPDGEVEHVESTEQMPTTTCRAHGATHPINEACPQCHEDGRDFAIRTSGL